MQYAVSQGIINLDDVRDSMKEKEKQRLLSKHKYKIFQDKDGRWKTTLPDESKKSKRRLIAKTSYNDLEKILIEYYATEEDKEVLGELKTIRDIYPVWLHYKSVKTNSSSYLKRIHNDWNKFYKNDPIVDIPINDLSYLILDEWAHSKIKNFHLTKKQYYNMTVIIRQIFIYAVDEGYIQENNFNRVKVNTKLFTKKHKPKSEEQVFLEEEETLLCEEALKRFKLRPKFLTPLAIVLNFHLGLRIGELVALKWSDISDNYIHIQRMEVAKYELVEGELIRHGVEVVEFTKSDSGDREIYLNTDAREILRQIRLISMKYGYYCNDYIFISNRNNRLTGGSFNKYLFSLCDAINIQHKSTHKVRKTAISTLIDLGLNINEVREIAGHEDEKTTLNNYCFNRKNKNETEKIIERMCKQA